MSSVVGRLAQQMRDATSRNPATFDEASITELCYLLHAAAAVLELMEQQHQRLLSMCTERALRDLTL